MRILRAAFFLSVIAVLAPSPPESEVQKALATVEIVPSNYEMLAAAGNTVSDLGQFCLRQPQVCKTANYVAAHLEAKAKYSVRKLYEWASDTGTSETAQAPLSDQADADGLVTGSTLRLAATDRPAPAHGNLKASDLIPAWRGAKI
jgi:hypothetical protein